ncbi:MAG: ectoine/hydroxyectoine ABC transporter permease subunit EhuD [Dethiobacteria bacterium]|jgi:polar amino acid transport system permease protein|nr:ectoine/hydroxyectoine ABC transporter permease subunit EhuD [Bacillota bacterium]HQD06065.1 ectoine/hydroxyectoine ABC transporter permease subunit EhuD [Bacillota bacterium]
MLWNWDYALSILPSLLEALQVTIYATIMGFAFALIFGLLLAFGRRSKIRVLSLISGAFVEFIRSTPLLAQLFFIFYALPQLPYVGISLSPLTAGILGLGIHYSTYLSEVYRAGIDAVPRGQWEAAIALNFSKGRTWLNIILPQAIPPIVPVLGNYLIGMFKDTPMLSAVTVVELLLTARIIGTHSFRFIEPFTMVGILFLVLSYISSLGVQWLEYRLNSRT